MKTKIIQTLRSAVQKLGVLAVGEELSQDEFRDCLVALNRVVDNYNSDGIFIGHSSSFILDAPFIENRCNIPAPTDITKAWKNKITFGKCGDYDGLKPIEFISLAFSESGTDYPLQEMSENEYNNISVKNVSAIPSRYLYKMEENGLGALYFNYIPQAGLKLFGSIKSKYTGTNSKGEPLNANDEVEWDEGIEAMIVYRTAIELAPDYGVRDASTLVGLLDDIEGKIVRKNAPVYTMSVEGSHMGSSRQNELRLNRARH